MFAAQTWGKHGGSRCFTGALDSVTLDDKWSFYAASQGPLRDLVCYDEYTLCMDRWTADDAIAAFEIAADLATPTQRRK